MAIPPWSWKAPAGRVSIQTQTISVKMIDPEARTTAGGFGFREFMPESWLPHPIRARRPFADQTSAADQPSAGVFWRPKTFKKLADERTFPAFLDLRQGLGRTVPCPLKVLPACSRQFHNPTGSGVPDGRGPLANVWPPERIDLPARTPEALRPPPPASSRTSVTKPKTLARRRTHRWHPSTRGDLC